MHHLKLYESLRRVPAEACKPILSGRLRGMTDINPMWRIKMLTKIFGPVGIGWRADITDYRTQTGKNGDIVCFVTIALRYINPEDGRWSEPVTGIGGALFFSVGRDGGYTDDEAYKKAYTDAIATACRSLGMGADVYWSTDVSKYTVRRKTDREKLLSSVEQNIRRLAAVKGVTVASVRHETMSLPGTDGSPESYVRINRWLEQQLQTVSDGKGEAAQV